MATGMDDMQHNYYTFDVVEMLILRPNSITNMSYGGKTITSSVEEIPLPEITLD
jgi:hypothetical protein